MLERIFLKRHAPTALKGEENLPDGAESLIIGVINQKGGCGKTTTVINLSACLAELGKKVLIVDIDPQGHATKGLGFRLSDFDNCLYHILVNKELHISSIVRETYHPNLHLIPSSTLLSSAQVDLINIVGREGLLKHKLTAMRPKYHMILIDCPPSLNLLTINALVAATKVIIPVQTHFYSIDGMSELFKTIDVIKQNLNPDIGILGVLPTLFDKRMKINHDVLRALREYFITRTNNLGAVKVFDSIIHHCVSLIESPVYGKPVIRYRPRSRGAEDYMNLAREIIAVSEPALPEKTGVLNSTGLI